MCSARKEKRILLNYLPLVSRIDPPLFKIKNKIERIKREILSTTSRLTREELRVEKK